MANLNQPGAYNVNWQELLDDAGVSLGGGSSPVETDLTLSFNTNGSTFSVSSYTAKSIRIGDVVFISIGLIGVTSDGGSSSTIDITGLADTAAISAGLTVFEPSLSFDSLNAHIISNTISIVDDLFESASDLFISGSYVTSGS